MNGSDARLRLSLVVEPGDPRLPAALSSAGTPQRLLDQILRGQAPAGWVERAGRLDRLLDAALTAAEESALRWVIPGSRQWPPALADLDHLDPLQAAAGAPLGLWVRGEANLKSLVDPSLAVVGARSCTTYGAEVAAELAADLGDAGVTVVSGAAFGIDAAGHRGALAVNRPTVAVLASGADVDSPRAHGALLSRIVSSGGLVVSEQPPGQVPLRSRFLSRNRLIAAMTTGTVVVEAARRSGSLNTLHWADRLGRPTMVVPGPVSSVQSAGVHQAVRDGKAVLVTDHRDVLEELGLGDSDTPPGPGSEPSGVEPTGLAPRDARVLDALAWERSVDRDDVVRDSGVSSDDVDAALDTLRGRGLARCVEGRWLLTTRAESA